MQWNRHIPDSTFVSGPIFVCRFHSIAAQSAARLTVHHMPRSDGGKASAEGAQQTRRRILERLFRSEAPGLARFVRSRIGRTEDVHDLVQEAFVSLAAARPQILLERPEAYLQRVTRNLVFERFRRGARPGQLVQADLDEALGVAVPPEQEWALEADDATSRYVAVLDTLGPQTREIFLLHRVDGLTYGEIADRVNLSIKSVEYHMGRALARLHQAFYGS
ncbi:sigma-70 family RNA polymerase sigma factor [Sphingobium sp. D43FB]|uniref:RNA polymerase sigma factor n=1 Tax=Sphingobium sp. D43FB TaxID=2017595 RepID=UPI001597076E|nr:sigma-70 family RNA polymerase sigma factor [Sphingobium sp. D43FB]